MATVIRATLADQAYRELRSRVMAGQLPGGRRLLPEELALELSISPTPIKEALLRLEADGLVVSPLRKGTMVRSFTAQDVCELYEARALIELDAIARASATGGVTPSVLAEMREALDRHAELVRRDTMDDLIAALAFDRKFHRLLIKAGGNRLIAEWHRRIVGQTHTAFVFNTGEHARSIEEHAAILAALEAGSGPAAQQALARHLARSRDDTLRSVQKMQANQPG